MWIIQITFVRGLLLLGLFPFLSRSVLNLGALGSKRTKETSGYCRVFASITILHILEETLTNPLPMLIPSI